MHFKYLRNKKNKKKEISRIVLLLNTDVAATLSLQKNCIDAVLFLDGLPSFRYHSLHHTEMGTNFCLFMPLFDAMGKTLKSNSWQIHEKISSDSGSCTFLFCFCETMKIFYPYFDRLPSWEDHWRKY